MPKLRGKDNWLLAKSMITNEQNKPTTYPPLAGKKMSSVVGGVLCVVITWHRMWSVTTAWDDDRELALASRRFWKQPSRGGNPGMGVLALDKRAWPGPSPTGAENKPSERHMEARGKFTVLGWSGGGTIHTVGWIQLIPFHSVNKWPSLWPFKQKWAFQTALVIGRGS